MVTSAQHVVCARIDDTQPAVPPHRMTPHRRKPWLAWMILWAFMLAALAPTVSRALAATATTSNPVGWVEICSPDGVQWVDPVTGEADTRQEPRGDGTELDRCPLCVLMGERLAAPPAPIAIASATLSATVAPLALQAPSPQPRYLLAAHPRGPPGTPALLIA